MLTPRVISFDQTQEGDTLQVRKKKKKKGITFSRDSEGIASFQSEGGWFTEERGQLVTHTATVIYLMHRPAPPLPTTPGTVFRATEMYGQTVDVVVFVRVNGLFKTQRAYTTDRLIDGSQHHDGINITAWEPIEGVTA